MLDRNRQKHKYDDRLQIFTNYTMFYKAGLLWVKLSTAYRVPSNHRKFFDTHLYK